MPTPNPFNARLAADKRAHPPEFGWWEFDILFHGWADPEAPAEPTVDYYRQVVDATFRGNFDDARKSTRLYMFPGMGHCGGGPGCNESDPLAALVAWAEKDVAPDYLLAHHRTNGVIDTSGASARGRSAPST